MNPRHPPISARSWRDIPQQLNHRALSSEGRRRVWLKVLKTSGVVVVVGALVWGGGQVYAAWVQ